MHDGFHAEKECSRGIDGSMPRICSDTHGCGSDVTMKSGLILCDERTGYAESTHMIRPFPFMFAMAEMNVSIDGAEEIMNAGIPQNRLHREENGRSSDI